MPSCKRFGAGLVQSPRRTLFSSASDAAYVRVESRSSSSPASQIQEPLSFHCQLEATLISHRLSGIRCIRERRVLPDRVSCPFDRWIVNRHRDPLVTRTRWIHRKLLRCELGIRWQAASIGSLRGSSSDLIDNRSRAGKVAGFYFRDRKSVV